MGATPAKEPGAPAEVPETEVVVLGAPAEDEANMLIVEVCSKQQQ